MLTRRAFISGGAAVIALGPLCRTYAVSSGQLEFNDRAYFFRWSDGKQFEFTPQGQDDLERWTDMLTIIVDRHNGTPDSLARWANNLVEAYRQKGVVLRTNSVPAQQTPAQHFLCAAISGKNVVECTFNRFLLMGDVAYSFIYLHRIYGSDEDLITRQMEDWIKRNAAGAESIVMAYAPVPDIDRLQAWQKAG